MRYLGQGLSEASLSLALALDVTGLTNSYPSQETLAPTVVTSELPGAANPYSPTPASFASNSSIRLFPRAFSSSRTEAELFFEPPGLFNDRSHCLEFPTTVAYHIHASTILCPCDSANLRCVTSSKILPSSACPAPREGQEPNTAS